MFCQIYEGSGANRIIADALIYILQHQKNEGGHVSKVSNPMPLIDQEEI